MKTAVALRHVHFEDLGTLELLLVERGYRIAYRDMGAVTGRTPNVESADLLVVLGAPIGAGDEQMYPFLKSEIKWIEQRLAARRPLLGICLGAQLMARVLGASVLPMTRKEIGFSPVELTAAGKQSPLRSLPRDVSVLHWHGDQFAIPAEAENLARTATCPHQAFAVGDFALGLQFHLEADADRLEPWYIGHAGELSAARISPVALRAQAKEHGVRLKAAATKVFGSWLDQFE
jgi:GMP synthase (glutamine-hydrolysing)